LENKGMSDDEEPTIIVITGGLSPEPQHATVDGVLVKRKPFGA
jgi:hypothetical protein